MKKNLRMLFLGLAAAAFGTGFAQENVTDKLINADLSKGVLGWNVEFTDHIWQKQTKGQSSYHGFNGACIQNWKSDATSGLTNSSISQTVKGLPNGTYVFGAYLAAAKKDSVENRDQVTGVYLYANDVAAEVATNWPEHTAQQWSHSAKFNVAANVTDSVLTVGIKNVATNANYIIFDNPTLYFFGDKDAETALNEMAVLDLKNSVALADTCKAHVMNVDTLAELNTAIDAAKAVTGVEGAYEADENLWWAFRHARSSVSDYRGLNNSIAAAKEVAGMEWSEFVADAVEALNALITDAEGAYTAATSVRTEINELKNSLNEAVALVQLDSVYIKIDEVTAALEDIVPGTGIGEYSDAMIFRIEELLELVGQVLGEVEASELAATTAKHRCDSLFTIVDDIFANPISFDEFPITLGRAETAIKDYKPLEGAVDHEMGYAYTSKTYRFEEPLKKVRFIVKETGSNGKCGDFVFFTLSSFEMFDENGDEITLTEDMLYSNADHNRLNPNATDGQGLGALVDDDPATFFHSTWMTVLEDHHYLEVTLPEGEYSAFSFAMTARGNAQRHQFPSVVEITYVSDVVTTLQNAVVDAKGFKPYSGTAPGFYGVDVTAYKETLAEAEALLASDNITDAAANVIIEKLEAERQKIDAAGVNMPEPGKLYRIISAGPFFEKQGVHKALTIHSDSARQNWIWWETASPDSAQQLFSFEYIENEENLPYYAVKNESTGLYIGQLKNVDEDGEESVVSNTAGLNVEKDTVELRALGLGQFGLVNDGMFHTGDHNSGTVGSGTPVYGCAEHGKLGDKSGICKWASTANSGSAWFIREVQKLPFDAKSISDLNFQSISISLYEGINSLTLTADKDCAFADLVVYDLFGEEIDATVSANGAVATVILDTTVVETFSFVFTNAEGVTNVKVEGAITKLSVLQERYDAALAVNPEKGDDLGQVSDLSEYEAALKAAENLLANGGADDVVIKAANDLDSAVAHLKYNVPAADKEYLLLAGLPAFKENHGVDMGIYVKNDALVWSYVGATNPNYLWKFVDCGELKYGNPAFYIQHVETGKYVSQYTALSTQFTLVSDPSETQPFRIDAWGNSEFTMSDCRYTDANFHMGNHGGGANVSGTIVAWNSGKGTASALRIVEKEAYLKELTDGIEDVEIADEFVAPAKKGIYDLYGRRIATPAATGIYIVDGKKRVIKK